MSVGWTLWYLLWLPLVPPLSNHLCSIYLFSTFLVNDCVLCFLEYPPKKRQISAYTLKKYACGGSIKKLNF